MMERTGKNLKLITKGPIRHGSEILIHIIQARGRLKAKTELSVTFEFSKQTEIPPANMEFIYLELSYSEYFSISESQTSWNLEPISFYHRRKCSKSLKISRFLPHK